MLEVSGRIPDGEDGVSSSSWPRAVNEAEASLERFMPTPSYKKTGVDTRILDAGLGSMFKFLRRTWQNRDHVRLDLGHYANVVDLGSIGVAISTDNVGTKAIIAQLMDSYRSVAIDCVAINVNDVLCVGAEPISMVDYLAVQRVDKKMMEEVGKGLAEGARNAKITIVGGETAQVPEMVRGEEGAVGFDLVGTCIGTVDTNDILTGSGVCPGDVVLGIPSSGIHCNGLTLARKAFGLTEDIGANEKRGLLSRYFVELGETLGEELIRPTRIYVREVISLLRSDLDVKGLAHISGDGFLNLPRLEADVGYVLDHLPEPQPVFQLIQEKGAVPDEEMYEVFNMGVGFCVVVPPNEEDPALEILQQHEVEAQRIGYVVYDPSRSVTLSGPSLQGWRGKGFEQIS